MNSNPNRNIERLEHIAQWLEDDAKHVQKIGNEEVVTTFWMDVWNEPLEWSDKEAIKELDWTPGECGAAMCIGGAAEQFFNKKEEGFKDAKELLGLEIYQGQMLFYPWDFFSNLFDEPITPQMAAKVIRHLISTGEVDWSILPGVERFEEEEEEA